MFEPKEHFPAETIGYNQAFVRRIRAKRRGIVMATPAPQIEPALIAHEFNARKRPEYSQKQIRSDLAAKAASIHKVTAKLAVDPADISRTAPEIIALVGSEFGVTASAIRGECRARFLVAVRHRAIVRIYLAKPRASLPQIGKWFGRDHTTILHAVQKAGIHKPSLQSPLYRRTQEAGK